MYNFGQQTLYKFYRGFVVQNCGRITIIGVVVGEVGYIQGDHCINTYRGIANALLGLYIWYHAKLKTIAIPSFLREM